MFDFFKRKKPPQTAPVPPPSGPAPSAAGSEEEIVAEVGRRVKQAFAAGNPENILKVLEEAYETHKESEGPAGWIAGVIGEKGIHPLFPLLADFVNRFPTSLYSAKALLADILASQEDFDEAGFLARHYLRLVADAGKLSQLGSLRVIRDGVSRSIYILAAPYGRLGARSYARRVLEFGCSLDLEEGWKESYRKGSAALEAELLDQEAKALDEKWEAFFASADHGTELFKRCEEMGYPRMAARVDLIEGRFRFNRDYRVDKRELLEVVVEANAPGGKIANALV